MARTLVRSFGSRPSAQTDSYALLRSYCSCEQVRLRYSLERGLRPRSDTTSASARPQHEFARATDRRALITQRQNLR